MCLVTSKCVPKSNGFVFTLSCISNSFILKLYCLSFSFSCNNLSFSFLFLETAIFLWQFALPFLIFPSAFVLPVPTALL